jgi:hypothetical protein
VDVCNRLEGTLGRQHGRRIPSGWVEDATLGLYPGVDDVVHDVRRLDGQSDEVLRALVTRAQGDEQAASVVVVALLPLALARCRGGRAQVDELIGELAIVIREAATTVEPPPGELPVGLCVGAGAAAGPKYPPSAGLRSCRSRVARR